MNQSDGRVGRASASRLVDSGFDSEFNQTNDFKVGIHSFPSRHSTLKGWCLASRLVRLLCRWERHVTGFPHLSVVDRWPATRK